MLVRRPDSASNVGRQLRGQGYTMDTAPGKSVWASGEVEMTVRLNGSRFSRMCWIDVV